jgi:hypothetical protein
MSRRREAARCDRVALFAGEVAGGFLPGLSGDAMNAGRLALVLGLAVILGGAYVAGIAWAPLVICGGLATLTALAQGRLDD